MMVMNMMMVSAVVPLLIVLATFLFHKWTYPKAMEVIPGNLGWPVIGESLSFLSSFSDPLGIYSFMKARQQRYGKVFKSFVLGRFTVFLTGREAGKIFILGRTVLVLEEASTFTLKVIGNMIMSLEPQGDEQEKFRTNFKIISSCFASLPFKIPGTAFHKGIKARDNMYEMLDSIILKRRNGEGFQQDFLESLIKKHSKDEGEKDDNKLTDKQMKDNILTLLVAGHDTTTAVLTWLIKFLEENPPVLERLRGEHLEIEKKRKDGSTLTWSEVSNMPYTAKVLSETLRRATILPWYSRKAAQDFEIDGYKIKQGWSLNLDVVSIHHDPAIYLNPYEFNPSRFDEPVKPFSLLGFGSGPRMCPGINLAKLEISIFIHHLVCRYKWKPLDRDNSVQPTLVRMPRSKYPISVVNL